MAAQLRTAITGDTEAMIVGHTDFSRYTTPRFCLIAVQHAVRILQRSIAAQEAADVVRRTDPVHDTLPAGVAPIARACAARFRVATVAPDELPVLFELALLGQQDTLASAIVTRRLALIGNGSPTARAALLLAIVQSYLAAAPARVTAAEALVTQLDALGHGTAAMAVLPSRLTAHQALLALGNTTADWLRVRHEVEAIRTLLHTLPAAQQDEYAKTLVDAYRSLLLLAAQQVPDSVPAFARQLQVDAQQLVSSVGHTRQDGVNEDLRPYATLPVDSVLWHLAVVGRGTSGVIGQPTAPLQADFWFPAKDTVPPGHGHVSLYVELPQDCYDSYWWAQVLDPITTGCQRTYDQLRRWAAQYDPQQVAITLVAAVVPQLGGTVLSGPETPEAAAQNLRWYFLDYLKLPVQHVAVQVIPITAPLPAPDGRTFTQMPYDAWSFGMDYNTPFQRQYHAGGNTIPPTPAVVLTGRDGRYWYGGRPSVGFERLLALALAAPRSFAPTSPAGAPAPQAASPTTTAAVAGAVPSGTSGVHSPLGPHTGTH